MSALPSSKVMSTAVDAVRELLEQRLRGTGEPGHESSQDSGGELPAGVSQQRQDERAALQVGLEELEVLWQELQDQVESLARERQRYADVFEYSPDACLVTDLQGVVREANHAAAELFGRASRYLAGKPLAVLIAAGEQREFRRRLANLSLDEGAARSWPSAVRGGDEGVVEVILNVRGMGMPRPVNGYCWVVRRRA